MRRKSNFAPSDSEEREDERCMGLHSNDMVEIVVCLCKQGCVCARVSVCMYTIRYSLACNFTRVKSSFFFFELLRPYCRHILYMKVFLSGNFQTSCLTDMLSPANKSQKH